MSDDERVAMMHKKLKANATRYNLDHKHYTFSEISEEEDAPSSIG